MPRRRIAAALLAAALVTAARAQPPFAQQPFAAPQHPLPFALVPYLGDERLHKELKLSGEQVKRLIAARQKMWDQTHTTAPKELDPDAQVKAAVAELKATLSAEQYKRAEQLAAQVVWTSRGGFSAGAGGAPDARVVPALAALQYPAVAETLNLDDAQQKLLAQPGGAASVYLTPKQTRAARALLGPLHRGTFAADFDPRVGFAGGGFTGFGGGFVGGFGGASVLSYSASPDVQKELKLTAVQIKALADLRAAEQPAFDFEAYQSTSPADRAKAEAEARAAADKELAKVLTADQLRRLKQIERQQSGPPSHPEFVAGGAVAKELGVTPAQLKQYGDLFEAGAGATAKALLAADTLEALEAAVKAERARHAAAVDAILTAEQRAKRAELLGEPFAGSVFGLPGNIATQQRLQFGRYAGELTTLTRTKGVQDELKLTAEQLQKLSGAAAEFRQKFPPQQLVQALQDEEAGGTFFAGRSAFVEKALADVLSKEQQARLRELMLQRLESPPAGGGFRAPGRLLPTAASYPGVADAIKLTAGQKEKLLGGDAPAGVLTAAQKEQIKGMLGKPADLAAVFAPTPGVGPPGAFGPSLSPENQLLLNTSVWDALKLTDDQVVKLVPAANEYTLARRRGFGPGFGGPGGPPNVDPKAVAAAVAAFEQAAADTLTGAQKKRLPQLAAQQATARGLDAFLLDPTGAAKGLALTGAQRQSLAALAAEGNRTAALLTDLPLPWEKELEVRRALRERFDARVRKQLTDEQRAKLEELTGEPFAGFERQPLGIGGFGGGPFGP